MRVHFTRLSQGGVLVGPMQTRCGETPMKSKINGENHTAHCHTLVTLCPILCPSLLITCRKPTITSFTFSGSLCVVTSETLRKICETDLATNPMQNPSFVLLKETIVCLQACTSLEEADKGECSLPWPLGKPTTTGIISMLLDSMSKGAVGAFSKE